jgi:mRNA interferase MazF
MYKAGDIILVPFPFTDLSSAKIRPALVLTIPDPHAFDVICCFISSKLEHASAHSVLMRPSKNNGLKVPSLVRFEKIATLDRRIVLGSIGHVAPAWMKEHGKIVQHLFSQWRQGERSIEH